MSNTIPCHRIVCFVSVCFSLLELTFDHKSFIMRTHAACMQSVNLASRMESTWIPGKIQCTKAVKDQAGKLFSFESRGLLHVKGKGEMEAFILTGRIDGSAPLPPVRPNLRQATQGKGGVNIFESLRKLKSTREMLGEKIGDMETHLEEEGT